MFSKEHSVSKHQERSVLDIDRSKEKSAIKSHPLFPLLEYLFFKCEHSTSNLTSTNTKVDMDEMLAMVASKSSDSLEPDLSSSGLAQSASWRTGNEDLDQLMLRAVQVLRVQLLELEKVEELCKDFCSRYISCLKGKVTQEMLLGWSDMGDDDSCSPPTPSSPFLFNGDGVELNADHANGKAPPAIVATMQTRDGQVSIPLLIPFLITTPVTSSPSSTFPAPNSAPVSNMTPYASLDSAIVKGSPTRLANMVVPASTVIAQPAFDGANSTARPPARVSSDSADTVSGDDKTQKLADSGSTSSGSVGKGKRGSLPRKAVDILRAWLFQNIRHPYPSEEEKRDLCTQSGLNLLQVNNWFINARRRILQPLLDGAALGSVSASDCSSSTQQSQHGKATASALSLDTAKGIARKKPSTNFKHCSATRYWPESLIPSGDRSLSISGEEKSMDEAVDKETPKKKKCSTAEQLERKEDGTKENR